MIYRGLFINLDRCTDRRDAFRISLAQAGIEPDSYLKFSALEPKGDEPQLVRGLKSRGELGIWLSLIACLDLISSGPFAEVVHICEDDTAFPIASAARIAGISHIFEHEAAFADFDVLFLDYFLTLKMFKEIVSTPPAGTSRSCDFNFMNARGRYLACTSSFLVRRSSAKLLADVLRKMLVNPERIEPVDMAIRLLLNTGILCGVIIDSPMTAPCWEQDEASTIQTQSSLARRQSERAHVTLRLVAAGIDSPFICAEWLSQIFGIPHDLCEDASHQDFLAFFEVLAPSLARF